MRSQPALREIAARPTIAAPRIIYLPSPSFRSNLVMTVVGQVTVRRSPISRVTAIATGDGTEIVMISVSEGGTTKMKGKTGEERTMTAIHVARTLVIDATTTAEAEDIPVGATGEAMVIDIGRSIGDRMRNICAWRRRWYRVGICLSLEPN